MSKPYVRPRSCCCRSFRSTGWRWRCANCACARGLEPVRRLRFPVVSIGNLSTGGAGKTPLTIALAQALQRHGLARRCALARLRPAAVSTRPASDPDGTAEEFGDEPLLIARETGVPVYVAGQTVRGRAAGRARSASADSRLRCCTSSTTAFSTASFIATSTSCC